MDFEFSIVKHGRKFSDGEWTKYDNMVREVYTMTFDEAVKEFSQ